MEEWKDIPGYEGYYQASSLGRIRSVTRTFPVRNRLTNKGNKIMMTVKGRLIKPTFEWGNNKPRYLVTLRKDNKGKCWQLGTLVCMAFLGIPEERVRICFKDGNRCNTSVDNLCWKKVKYKRPNKHSLELKNGVSDLTTNEEVYNEVRGLVGTI